MTSILRHNLIAGLSFSSELWKDFVRKKTNILIDKILYFNLFQIFSNLHLWNQYNVQLGEYFNYEVQ